MVINSITRYYKLLVLFLGNNPYECILFTINMVLINIYKSIKYIKDVCMLNPNDIVKYIY